MDAFLFRISDQLVLGQVRVSFDLVGSRSNPSRFDQRFDVGHGEVGHANVPDLQQRQASVAAIYSRGWE